ncbi:MAG TPA: hypothetical protein VMN36_17575 [Verrucomicrobiales bacterium]|nr:hypothetical protein [Verrucomicrobiales bacterium]
MITRNPNFATAGFAAGLFILNLAGCTPESATPGSPAISVPPSLEAVFTSTAPPGAVSIAEARRNPQPGEPIVLFGKVMGVREPFVAERAVMVIGDDDVLASCDESGEDPCKTPWDCCCEDKTLIRNHIVTVQALDSSGSVIQHTLEDLHGLDKLSRVVVSGVIGEGSSPETLIVNASAIHVEP